jgi:hypothetical protein
MSERVAWLVLSKTVSGDVLAKEQHHGERKLEHIRRRTFSTMPARTHLGRESVTRPEVPIASSDSFMTGYGYQAKIADGGPIFPPIQVVWLYVAMADSVQIMQRGERPRELYDDVDHRYDAWVVTELLPEIDGNRHREPGRALDHSADRQIGLNERQDTGHVPEFRELHEYFLGEAVVPLGALGRLENLDRDRLDAVNRLPHHTVATPAQPTFQLPSPDPITSARHGPTEAVIHRAKRDWRRGGPSA